MTEAGKISIKIPPFWIERPEIWFHQIEAQFMINGITQEKTKFNHIVAQLEPHMVENIYDIIQNDSENKYTIAKDRLLAIYKESEEKRLKKLLTGLEIGDQKPSQLLRRMKSLGTAEDVPEKLIKTLWLDKLPENIKSILIISNEGLDKLAEMADKIGEMSPHPEICNSEVNGNYAELMATINTLKEEISALKLQNRSRPSQ